MPPLPPNHHAHHPPFDGVRGVVAALFFTVGRRADAELAIALTGAGPGDHVVDVGCGSGAALRRVAARGASSVTGVDPAVPMLRLGRVLTRRRDRPTTTYRQGAAETLPLPDGAATVVWALASVHHWSDLGAGLGEVRRVLAPGGRFLAIESAAAPAAADHDRHGWSPEQTALFVERCAAAGFTDVTSTTHTARRRPVVSVVSRG